MKNVIPSSTVHKYLESLSQKNFNLDPKKNIIQILFDLSKYNYTKMNDLGNNLFSPLKKQQNLISSQINFF